ncbi:MAG: S8 family serine peptidase, partial [Geobacteraceae bacterium]|nr:S8 family serine peptidase [Geobacteraceae bacterium]
MALTTLRSLVTGFMVFMILTLLTSIPAIAVSSANMPEPSIALIVKDRRITLRADNTSYREILKQITAKTGIKTQVLEGVADKKVSVDVKDIPYLGIGTILDKMGIANYGIAHDRQSGDLYVYVVNAGSDLAEITKGKTLVRKADFGNQRDITKVKGKQITTRADDKKGYAVSYINDELLIKFHRGTTAGEISDLLARYKLNATPDTTLSKLGYTKITIPDGRGVLEVAKELTKERIVKSPEPNYIQKILTVSDPLYQDQWYAAATRIESVWPTIKSTALVTVAVIDTGVQAGHPDLSGRTLKGYDFTTNNPDANDDNGHGTFVSGIIAANSNNIGIRGLYNNARILPVKVMDANGAGTYEDAAKGIIYAADNGAKVINLSIGGYGYSPMLLDAVNYAQSKGCILIAAGGNDSIEKEVYPAGYPDVIGVAAMAGEDAIWQSSNTGRHIAVAAPGANIISTSANGGYSVASGTSAAAPMVTALAAILTAERPDLSSSVIARLIQQTARDLGEKGRDKVYGTGAIDAVAALGQPVKTFHDVAVKGVWIETSKVTKGNSIYVAADLSNIGSYSKENCDVILYSIIDNEKTKVSEISQVSVVGQAVAFMEWYPKEFDSNVEFESVAICNNDENLSNNTGRTSRYSVRTNGNLHTMYPEIPPVHGWIAYQAYKLLPDSPLKQELANYINLPTGDEDNYLSSSFNPDSVGWNDKDNAYPSCQNANSPCFTALLEGAWEEDNPSTRSLSHFWDSRGGYRDGLGPNNPWGLFDADSAVIAGNDRFKNAIEQYMKGTQEGKNFAYWWLGRTAHLLADMAAPAHALKDAHGRLINGSIKGSDSYENWLATASNYKKVKVGDSIHQFTIPSYRGKTHENLKDLPSKNNHEPYLTELFYTLSNFGHQFDSDDQNGTIRNGKDNTWSSFVNLDKNYVNNSINTDAVIVNGKPLTLGTDYEIHRSILGGPDGLLKYKLYFYETGRSKIGLLDWLFVYYDDGSH